MEMNIYTKKANKTKFDTIIKNLEKRYMDGFYCETVEEACEKGLSLIKDGSLVSWGGSVTVNEIGLFSKLQSRDLTLVDPFSPPTPEEAYDQYRKAMMTDYFLMGTNAITMDGQLVNIDGTGNRVAALILGPKEVLVFAGANKVTEDVESALARIRVFSSPPNAVRLQKEKTPCVLTGKCGNCLLPETMCRHTVITRACKPPGRLKVFLINEDLGY